MTPLCWGLRWTIVPLFMLEPSRWAHYKVSGNIGLLDPCSNGRCLRHASIRWGLRAGACVTDKEGVICSIYVADINVRPILECRAIELKKLNR